MERPARREAVVEAEGYGVQDSNDTEVGEPALFERHGR